MSDNTRELTLPASPKELSEFILKLLGKGRTTGKKFDRIFLIDLQALHNLNHIICQRVTQNNSAMSYFESEFEFSDGHYYKINSNEEFLRHAFVQFDDCVKVRM